MNNYFIIKAGQKKKADLVFDSEPGAHAGPLRLSIPGFLSANRVFLNTATGSDASTGANPVNVPPGTGPKLTYAAAAVAAGATKKIVIVNNGATLSGVTVSVPTEMEVGTVGNITGNVTAPVSTWTARVSSFPVGGFIQNVTWSPKLALFVAVGNATGGVTPGRIATSPDGITWTQRVSPFNNVSEHLFKVVWSPELSLFVVSSNVSPRIATSPDGITWTLRTWTTGLSDILPALEWSKELGLFVGGGIKFLSPSGVVGVIVTSPDGITWTQRDPAIGAEVVYSIVWSKEKIFWSLSGHRGRYRRAPTA
ncbi:MAG: hypothetical protein IPJ01_12010 [Micavibrio sp.]|nr:hypothetical protein [Micavibrio sp.]